MARFNCKSSFVIRAIFFFYNLHGYIYDHNISFVRKAHFCVILSTSVFIHNTLKERANEMTQYN